MLGRLDTFLVHWPILIPVIFSWSKRWERTLTCWVQFVHPLSFQGMCKFWYWPLLKYKFEAHFSTALEHITQAFQSIQNFFYDSHLNFNTDNHTNISFSLTFSVKLFNFIKLQFLLYICRRNLVHREFFFFFLSLPFFFSRAAPVTYGSSWVGGWLRAIAASLCHSHGKTGSLTHSLRPGIEPESSRDYDDP